MIWLEAALAFALIMLIFATMVSVTVEAGMRVFLARESGFQRMLEKMYDEMIRPRLTDLVDKSKVDSREDFIEKLSINPATPLATGLFAWLRKWTVPRKNTSMTVMQFADRLADTDVGREIAKQTRDHVEVLIKDLAQKFENVGASATAYYTRHAASISMIEVCRSERPTQYRFTASDRACRSGLRGATGNLCLFPCLPNRQR